MTTFVRDSKNLKEKLQEIMPWEVLILNKLYNSSSHVFNSLAHFFQHENVNFVELRYAVTKIFADLSLEKYTSYLKASYISPLVDSLYSISDQINASSPSFLNQNVDDMLSTHFMSNNSTKQGFLTQSLKAEIKQIEASEHLEGKILAENDFDTLMNICNLLAKPDLHHSSFNFMRILDAIKSSEEAYFLTKDLQYLDILVLSALGHCRSWSRIFKDGIQSQKIIPSLLKWAQYMKTEYKEFLDFQVHHSLLSKRHLRETAKKHIMKGSHPEFIQAVRRRRYDEVLAFLQSGVSVESIDPEDKNKPALHIACQNGDIEMVKILEKYACDFEGLDYEQLTPIFYAISSENLELIKYVLSKGVNIEHNDNQNRTPFYWACCQCTEKIVNFLHDQKCNVNALSRLQRSPLTKAAYLGRADIVELLLSYKETIVDLPGNKGRTALHNAVWGKAGGREGKRIGSAQQEDSPDSALILLKKGANVNLKDADGNTPLAIAAASHADRSLPVLIAFGADSNMPNNMGETPFYQACKWGHLEICEIMMQNYSPDPFVKSNAGLDSFEVSIVNEHYELAVFLLQKLNRKIVDNDDYFDAVIRTTSQHFTSDVKIKFLTELLKARPSPPLQFLHDETLRTLIKLKDEQIVKMLQEYLRLWVAKTGMKGEEKVRVIIEEAIKMHWIACCRILYSEYPQEISSFELGLGKFDGLGSLRGEDLFFLIENFNMDIFTPDAKGETLLHTFVCQRSMNALLDLLNLVTDVIKEKRKVANQYLSKIDMEFVKELVKAKNKQGCSALDSALINKFYEIHGVLTKFLGEDLEGSIRLAKYKIEMRPAEEAKEHCMKEMLVERTKKLKEMSMEFGQKDGEKGDSGSKSPNKKERKMMYKGDLSLCTYKVQKRELEYLEKALMVKENMKEKLDKKGGDKGKGSLNKKMQVENDRDERKEDGELKINIEKVGEQTPSPIEGIVVQREVSFIDDEKELERVCREIEEYSLLGVDSEYYLEDREKHIGFICLLQLSTIKQDYIVDCIKLHQVIFKHLAPIFKSEAIVKVFHGCESDLKWLKADFDIDVVNLFDTSKALMIINNTDLPYSLTYLTSTYLGFALDKSYQKADWRVRPLPKGMLEYARKDSCVLLYLWYLLDGELKYKGPEKMIKMAKNMAVKCWKTLEKSVKSSIEIISLE